MRAAYLFAVVFLAACGGQQPVTIKAKPAAPIQVIAVDDPGPAVNFRVVVRAGSAFDPTDRKGLSYLLATTMVEGGTESMTYAELLDTLHPWAASISVQVDRDNVVFIARCHIDHVEKFYPLFRDVLLHPRLDAVDIDRIRAQALEVLTKHIRTADDEELSKLVLESVLFRGHPYAHPPLGTEKGLKAISRGDLLGHKARTLAGDRTMVGVAGPHAADLAERLRADLAQGWPAKGNATQTIPAPPADARRLVVIDQPAGGATAISLGHHLPVRRGHADFPALALTASYFGEHRQFQGVLFQSIREKRGMNYGDYAYVEAFRQEGWGRSPLLNIGRQHQTFSMWIRPVPNHERHFALRIALWNLKRLLDDGIPAASIEATRNFLSGYLRLGQQTAMRRLGAAMDDRDYKLDGSHLDGLIKGFAGLTDETVHTAIKTHIRPQDLTMVVVTPDAKGFVAAVLAETESPKTYASAKPADVVKEDAEIAKFVIGLKPEQIEIIPAATLFSE